MLQGSTSDFAQTEVHILSADQGRGRTLCDAWHFSCIWIIHQNVTSHPVKKRAERQNQI